MLDFFRSVCVVVRVHVFVCGGSMKGKEKGVNSFRVEAGTTFYDVR